MSYKNLKSIAQIIFEFYEFIFQLNFLETAFFEFAAVITQRQMIK